MRSTNVIDNLGFTPERAAALKLKTELHSAIVRLVKEKNLSSRQIEKLLDVPQPRVSELLTGKISKMSAEKLTGYLFRLGRRVEIITKPRRMTDEEKIAA